MPIAIPRTTHRPFIRYAPLRDEWLINGEAGSRVIKLDGQAVAIDIERVQCGWLTIGIDGGRRSFTPIPLTGPAPPRPVPEAEIGYSVDVYAPKALGSSVVHEMRNRTHSHNEFIARLYNECEPLFGRGEVPLVVFGPTQPVQRGGHETRLLRFEIKRWVLRDEAFPGACAKAVVPRARDVR